MPFNAISFLTGRALSEQVGVPQDRANQLGIVQGFLGPGLVPTLTVRAIAQREAQAAPPVPAPTPDPPGDGSPADPPPADDPVDALLLQLRADTCALSNAVSSYSEDPSEVQLAALHGQAEQIIPNAESSYYVHRIGLTAIAYLLAAWAEAHPGFEDQDDEAFGHHHKRLEESGVAELLQSVCDADSLDAVVRDLAAQVMQAKPDYDGSDDEG